MDLIMHIFIWMGSAVFIAAVLLLWGFIFFLGVDTIMSMVEGED